MPQTLPLPHIRTHTRSIGIIYPPPDIRNIVDKTSKFVAKNGPEFENMIIKDNSGNAKFNFLNASNPYHAYYQRCLSEARLQYQPSPQEQPAESIVVATPAVNGMDTAEKPDRSASFRPVSKVLEPPEIEQYTIQLPEGITQEELEIIKVTAQFVARNGMSFLTDLTSREINNSQFNFLKPTHSMFMFFKSLVDAYLKVLKPPKELVDKLRKSVTDVTRVLDRCLHRLEWEQLQEQARQKAEQETELERLQMAETDWHDFFVVDSIDFAENEDVDLPSPMTLEEVMMRSKVSSAKDEETVKLRRDVEMEVEEDELQLVEEGMRADEMESSKAMIVADEQEQPGLRILKNWKRPEERIHAESNPTNFVVSSITGELIPINEISEHIRISLIDPKFKEQKERMFAKIRDTTLAPDDEITKNIVGLARMRPDIFGTTQEEIFNAVKAAIEKGKDDQGKEVIWDGHIGSIPKPQNIHQSSTPTVDGVLAPPPPRPPVVNVMPPIQPPPPPLPMMQQAFMVNQPLMPPYMSINLPAVILSAQPGPQLTPLATPQPFVTLSSQPVIPPGMPSPSAPKEGHPILLEEPEPKRKKLDDSALISEDEFLVEHLGPARVSVSIPNLNGGNVEGRLLEITMQSLSEPVSSLKEKIAGKIPLPPNKQKLSGKAGILKDHLSLAYYNVASGETLSLSLRERGGRKR